MQFLSVGVRQSADLWPDCLGEMGQHLGIQCVGLGQTPGGLGEIAHLAHNGQGAAASASASGNSKPPVDSRTTTDGHRACNSDTRSRIPAVS